jgi:two-component system response regulator RegA
MRFLVVDDHAGWRGALVQELAKLGHELWVSEDIGCASHIVTARSPDFVVTELRIGQSHWHDLLPIVRSAQRPPEIIIATAFGSVATAIRAIKTGVAAYLLKPLTAKMLLAAIEPEEPVPAPIHFDQMTLDQAIWEYINYSVDAAGSIAGAARNLGLDRRSLRRMLAKYAPGR